MEDEEQIRHLRHDLRGRLNVIRLCTAAMEIGGPSEELLPWLNSIEKAADEVVVMLDSVNGSADA